MRLRASDSIRNCAHRHKRTIKKLAAGTQLEGPRCRDMPDRLPISITICGLGELIIPNGRRPEVEAGRHWGRNLARSVGKGGLHFLHHLRAHRLRRDFSSVEVDRTKAARSAADAKRPLSSCGSSTAVMCGLPTAVASACSSQQTNSFGAHHQGGEAVVPSVVDE